MINEGRTLLLNRDGNKRPSPDFFFEEYVPVEYRALTLPSFLSTVYTILMGGVNSDQAFANLRLRQYMTLIHSTEFAEYLTALDPRITYLTSRSVVSDDFAPLIEEQMPATSGLVLSTVGRVAQVGVPRLQFQYAVEVVAPGYVTVTFLQTNKVVQTQVALSSGLTNLISVPGQSELFFRLGGTSLTVGAKWLVSFLLEPDFDVTALVEPLTQLGDEVLSEIFPAREPFTVFKKLWEEHPYLPYRLTGFLLAYIYRVEEVRRGG